MGDNYGVKRGQIYFAADGGNFGCVVASDPEPGRDVLVYPFSPKGYDFEGKRWIDTFKLAMVRYFYIGLDSRDS